MQNEVWLGYTCILHHITFIEHAGVLEKEVISSNISFSHMSYEIMMDQNSMMSYNHVMNVTEYRQGDMWSSYNIEEFTITRNIPLSNFILLSRLLKYVLNLTVFPAQLDT